MVKIRLSRVGRKHKPTYRIVVSDSKSPNKGRFIDNIGHFNPRTEPESIVLKADRALHWLSQGAQPSDAVARILRVENVIDKKGAILQAMANTAGADSVSETSDRGAAETEEEPVQ